MTERLKYATEFTLTPQFVDEHQNRPLCPVTISYRGHDTWAVILSGCTLHRDGAASYEPLPSSRTDEYRAATRFTLDEAFALAEPIVASMCKHGWPSQTMGSDCHVCRREARDADEA